MLRLCTPDAILCRCRPPVGEDETGGSLAFDYGRLLKSNIDVEVHRRREFTSMVKQWPGIIISGPSFKSWIIQGLRWNSVPIP